jgi:hypothetical protein
MYSRFSAVVRFSAPPLETRFRGPASAAMVVREPEMARDQMVDRNLSGTARDEQEKACGPDAVRWPGARIDEDFDHYRHEQQAESGKACRKPEHEQNRKKMLAQRRQVGGCCGVDDRQLVLIGKEGDRARFEMQARDLKFDRIARIWRRGRPGRPARSANRECGPTRRQYSLNDWNAPVTVDSLQVAN